MRAYMLYGDRIFLERFKESANRIKQLIDEVQVVRSERKPLIIQIRDLHNRYITYCEQEIIPLVIPDQPVNIEAVISAEREGVSLAKELIVLTGRLEELRQKDTLNSIHTAIYNENLSKILVIIFSILTMLVGGLFTILLIIKLTEQNSIHEMIMRTTQNAYVSVDSFGIITNFNHAAENIFEIKEAEVLGKYFNNVFTEQNLPGQVAFKYPLMKVLESRQGICSDEFIYIKNDWKYNLMIECLPFNQYWGKSTGTGALLIVRDITERKVIEERLRGMATRDGLTMLYNHKYMMESLSIAVTQAKKDGSFLAYILMDIDNFKYYNDNFGHPAGDVLLQMFSRLLESIVREDDVISRYGGDEFGIILHNTDQKVALEICKRIETKVMEYNFPFREQLLKGMLTVSVGMAMFPLEAKNAEDLIKIADNAMYKAKRINKNKLQKNITIL